MAKFEKIIPAQGGDPIYKNLDTKKPVKPEDLPEAVREELDLGEPGIVVDEELISQEEGDGIINPKDKKNNTEEDEKESTTSNKPAAPNVEKDNVSSTQKAAQRAANGTTPKANEDEETEDERKAREAAEPAEVPEYSNPVPQSTPGMGFPRKNGKTVDFFDGETPHTHMRAVAGFAVPLTEENYRAKTDAEIYKKLRDEGYIN